MPVFECRTELTCAPETVFDFVTRPANMKAIAPKDVDLVFVEAPEVIQLGTKLKFKVQAYGVPQHLEHEIIAFDAPRSFSEKMIKGPLPAWQHHYIIDPHTNGAVLLNRIEFEPPGGMLGMILTAERMLEHLEQGYAHRSEALKKALNGWMKRRRFCVSWRPCSTAASGSVHRGRTPSNCSTPATPRCPPRSSRRRTN
jgi:ligand-binding SRPBCC domain-containing protein